MADFAKLFKLDRQVAAEFTSVRWIDNRTPDYIAKGRHDAWKRADTAFWEAFNALSEDEIDAYGLYRRDAMSV